MLHMSHMFYTACGLVFILVALVAAPACSAHAHVLDGNRIMDQRMSENLCALSFDDGPSPNTPHLLDMLNDYGIPATFFLLGRNAARYPHLVRRMLAEGHEIGNHSWSHPNLRAIPVEEQRQELERTNAVLREQGVTPRFMRPPYGAYDDNTVDICRNLGMRVVLWSLDSQDWKHLPTDYALLRSTRGLPYEKGRLHGIFLFHDTKKRTVDDLPRIIAQLLAGGCERFVTVSEYLDGALDPEPPLLMTRHPWKPQAQDDAALTEARPQDGPLPEAVPAPAAPESLLPQEPSAAGPHAAPMTDDLGKLPLMRSSLPWHSECTAATRRHHAASGRRASHS